MVNAKSLTKRVMTRPDLARIVQDSCIQYQSDLVRIDLIPQPWRKQFWWSLTGSMQPNRAFQNCAVWAWEQWIKSRDPFKGPQGLHEEFASFATLRELYELGADEACRYYEGNSSLWYAYTLRDGIFYEDTKRRAAYMRGFFKTLAQKQLSEAS